MSNSDPSSPVQTKGLRSFSVSAPYPSNHEVDNARLILENNNSNFVRFKKGKSRTIDKRTVYEEIEGLQTELLKREKDYQLVVEVGKMLLEKNKELSDQDEMLKRQFNHSLQERDTKITQLCSKLESYETLERDMLNEIKGLRLQVNSFKSGNDSSEAKALELYNEYKKVEEELKQAKQQLVQQRTKNKELVEESEKYKSELEALQTNERILRRQLKSTSSMLSVASENLNSPRKEAESEVTQDKLAEDLKMTQKANQRLEKQLEDLFKENSKLKEQVEQREQAQDQLELTLKALHSTNQRLQRQEEEQKRLLEEKVTVISNLQNQIEESIVGGPHSLIGFRSSKSLDRELLQSNLNKMQEEEKRGGRRKSVGRTTSTEFSSLAAELSVANLENSGNSLAAELGIATDFKKTKSVSFDGNNEGTSPNSLRNSNSNNPLSNSSDVGLQKSRSNSSTNSMNVVEQKTRSNSSTNSMNVVEQKTRSNSSTEQKNRSNSTSNKYEEQSNTTSTPVSPSTSTTHTNEEAPVISVTTTTETPTATSVTTNTPTTTTTRSVLEVSSPLTPTPEDEEEEEQEDTTTKATSSPIRVPPLPLVDTDTDNNSLSSNQSGFSRENSIDDNLNKTYEEEYIDSAEEEEFQPIETMDKSQLSEELIKFRDHKREESKYSRMFAEMRERLNGAEIRNLTRLMRTQNFIFDLIDISNSIIDGVSKDIQNKILDNPPDNPLVHLLAAVLYETCRLRKISNDYMEAINRGTVEKLEEWTKKFYEAEQQTLMQQQQDLQQSHSNTNSPADSGKKKNWFWQKWFDKNEN